MEGKPPAGRSRFVSNTAALATSTVATAVLTLLQVKILSTFLSPGVFGLFAALRGLSLLLSMLATNGFPQLLVRYLPFFESRRQTPGALVLSGVCFLAPLFLLTVLVFVTESARGFFFRFVPASLDADAGLFFWFYACTLGVTLKLVLYGGLNGLRRLPAQVVIEVASLVVQVVWIYLWRDRLTVEGLFLILAVTSLGAAVIGLPWYLYRLAADTAARSHRGAAPERPPNAAYAGYWVGATGLSLVAVAFTDVDRYLLSRVLALEVLSQFHIGSRVLRMVNRFLSVPVLSFQPEVTRLDAEDRGRAVRFSTRVFLKFNAAVAWVGALVVWAFAPEVVRLVSSADYSPAVPLLRIMVFAVPLTAMTAPLTTVMKAGDRVRRALYCDLAWAVVYVCLLYVLGGAFGLAGVGLAHVAASLGQVVLAAALGRDVAPLSLVVSTGLKIPACGIAFAPLLAAGLLLPASGSVFVARVALFAAGLFVFRYLVRKTGVLDPEERRALHRLLDRPVLGAAARRII